MKPARGWLSTSRRFDLDQEHIADSLARWNMVQTKSVLLVGSEANKKVIRHEASYELLDGSHCASGGIAIRVLCATASHGSHRRAYRQPICGPC